MSKTAIFGDNHAVDQLCERIDTEGLDGLQVALLEATTRPDHPALEDAVLAFDACAISNGIPYRNRQALIHGAGENIGREWNAVKVPRWAR